MKDTKASWDWLFLHLQNCCHAKRMTMTYYWIYLNSLVSVIIFCELMNSVLFVKLHLSSSNLWSLRWRLLVQCRTLWCLWFSRVSNQLTAICVLALVNAAAHASAWSATDCLMRTCIFLLKRKQAAKLTGMLLEMDQQNSPPAGVARCLSNASS